jgi:hypothetical protein
VLKRLAIVAPLQIVLGFALSVMAFAQLAPSASEIDRSVTTALRELYSHNEAANALGAKAKAVLVFPDIKKRPSSSVRSTVTGRSEKVPGPSDTTERVRPRMGSRLG